MHSLNDIKQDILHRLVAAGMPAEEAGFEINRCFAMHIACGYRAMTFSIGSLTFTISCSMDPDRGLLH